MVRDYVTDLYEPTAASADALRGDDHARARALAAWKAAVLAGWDGVKVGAVEADDDVADLGTRRAVQVAVALGALSPGDVAVQLVHGRVAQHGELESPAITTLAPDGGADAGAVTYRGEIACDLPGRYGFTVRVLPSHPDLPTPLDLGRLTWA
ncbi:MAG: hypothetical protein R2746_09790 [Acidimicrobiales bacterium]